MAQPARTVTIKKAALISGAVFAALLVLTPALAAPPVTHPAQISFVANGGTSRTLAAKLGDVVSVRDFGAVGDGVTNDAAAVQAALTAVGIAGGQVYFPPGSYLCGSALSIPAFVTVRGANQSNTKILRGFTGDFITSMGGFSAIYDITIDGQTSTWGTGRGIVVSSGSNQAIYNSSIQNFVLACLEFSVANAGTGFASYGSSYYTTGTQGTQGAVRVNATDVGAAPRKFYATESGGCTLFDIGGANHFYASGFYTNGMIFGAASFAGGFNNARFGALGGTVAVQGSSHHIDGVAAVPFSVAGASHVISVETGSWAFTDTSAGSSILQIGTAFATTWTGASTNPVLGNGTLSTRASRQGGYINIQVDLSIGSTTTLGTGAWQFALPQAAYGFSPNQICGTAYMQNGAGTAGWVGAVRVVAAATVANIFYGAGASFGAVAAATPFAWDTGATLRFNCEYRVP